jgi:hypothetical protein
MLTCTGIADSVDLARVTRSAFVSKLAFQVGILAATLSTSFCSSARVSRRNDSGIPRYLHGKCAMPHGNACWTATMSPTLHLRYLHGKCATPHGNACWTATMSPTLHLMGVVTHFSTLVINPDTPAKRLRICAMQFMS